MGLRDRLRRLEGRAPACLACAGRRPVVRVIDAAGELGEEPAAEDLARCRACGAEPLLIDVEYVHDWPCPAG